MSDNVIFQGQKVESSPNGSIPKPEVQPAPNIVPKPMWQQEAPPPSSPFPFILKAILGLVVVFIVGFIVFTFVIPRLTNKNEQVTLTYWGLWEGENTVKNIIADFEKQNPNINVVYEKHDIKQYRERVATRIQNGSGPDIFRFHNTWLPQMVTFLLPLPSDALKKDDLKFFYPVIQNDLIQNGAIYGIPLSIDTLALFVNTEIFQQSGVAIPTNWQDFGAAARALTVKDENGKIKTSGAALGTYDNIVHSPDIISLLFIQNGADIKDLSGGRSAIDALDFYTSFAKGEASVWDDTLDSSTLAFAKGNLAMYFGYSWDVFTIKALAPNLNFQIVSVPHLPGRNMTMASYWVEGVSIKSKHQKEALLFLKFISQKETVQKLFLEQSKTRLFGEPYARVDLAESLKNNPIVYPFVSGAKDAVSSFFASDTFDNGLNSQMNGYLGNAIRSILSNTSAETAVDTLAKGVTQVLNQYGGQ